MSISEFFSAGGFGLYVWSSYGIALAFIVAEIIYLKRKHHATKQQLQKFIQLNTTKDDESQA